MQSVVSCITQERGLSNFTSKSEVTFLKAIKMILDTLEKEKDWILAIDQSTSIVGICMSNIDGDILIADYVVPSKESAFETFDSILNFLNIFTDFNILKIVPEAPPPSSFYSRSNTVLQSLFFTLKKWFKDCKANGKLNQAKFEDKFYPQTWRKNLLGQRYKKSASKIPCFEILQEEYIILDYHFQYIKENKISGYGYDSSDAVGIYNGFIKNNYDLTSNTEIMSQTKKRKQFKSCVLVYKYVDNEIISKLENNVAIEEFGILPNLDRSEKCVLIKTHKDLTHYETSLNALEKNKYSFFIEKDIYDLLNFCIRFSIPWQKNKSLVVIVTKKEKWDSFFEENVIIL